MKSIRLSICTSVTLDGLLIFKFAERLTKPYDLSKAFDSCAKLNPEILSS